MDQFLNCGAPGDTGSDLFTFAMTVPEYRGRAWGWMSFESKGDEEAEKAGASRLLAVRIGYRFGLLLTHRTGKRKPEK